MANVTTNMLPQAALPVSGNDILTITRDGVVISQIKLTDLIAGLTPTNSSVAPNATVPYDALVATGAATNIDVAIVPKGTGAFSLQVADGAITGGNKRGANSVDLQTSRTAATQVASGQYSFAATYGATASGIGSFCAGIGSTASGYGSVCLGSSTVFGFGNTASNEGSVAIGAQNVSSGSFAVAIGRSNTASGLSSIAIGGDGGLGNAASGALSFACGKGATTNGIAGQVAFGHNSNLLGGYQTTLTGLRQVTTGTNPQRATADQATPATANQLTLRNNSVFKFMGRVVAYDLTTLDAKEWEFSGLIKRGANAAATSLVGTPSVTSQFADTNAAAWTVAVSADTTNGALAVNVTGAGANQIRWYVEVFAYETGV